MRLSLYLVFGFSTVLLVCSPLFAKDDKKLADPVLNGEFEYVAGDWDLPTTFPFSTKIKLMGQWEVQQNLLLSFEVQAKGSALEASLIEGRWGLLPGLKVAAGFQLKGSAPSAQLADGLLRLDQSRFEDWFEDVGFLGGGQFVDGRYSLGKLDIPLVFGSQIIFSGAQFTPSYRGQLTWEALKNQLWLGASGQAELRVLSDGAGHNFARDSFAGSATVDLDMSPLRLLLVGSGGLDIPKAPKNPGDVPLMPRLFYGGETELSLHFGKVDYGIGGSWISWRKDVPEDRWDAYGLVVLNPIKALTLGIQGGGRATLEGDTSTLVFVGRISAKWEF